MRGIYWWVEGFGHKVVSEVYHATANGTSGACDIKGRTISNVTSSCLIAGGYGPTFIGM